MELNPFSDSSTLAEWTAENLMLRGLDEVSDWRMLEYWFQVEIFRLAQSNRAGAWRHIGNYEHPYHTELPRSGSKTKTKWIDLVLARPTPETAKNIVWIELKDLGRSESTVINNAKGLGHDLAALWALSPKKTQALWLNPQPHSMDRGRLNEWNEHGPVIEPADHLIAQIVISHKLISTRVTVGDIIETWLASFLQLTGETAPGELPEISCRKTEEFNIFGLVMDLPKES